MHGAVLHEELSPQKCQEHPPLKSCETLPFSVAEAMKKEGLGTRVKSASHGICYHVHLSGCCEETRSVLRSVHKPILESPKGQETTDEVLCNQSTQGLSQALAKA